MIVSLLLTMAIPLAAAAFLMVFRRSMSGHTPRWIALGATVATLLVSISLAQQFRALPAAAGDSPIRPRFEQTYHWFSYNTGEANSNETVEFDFRFGLDGISLALVVLTTVLTVSCVLISWESIADREAEFYTALLALEAGLIAVFSAFDLMLFYVAFEFTLIPLFFMIGIWGGPRKRYAAVKFFLYTLVVSLIKLVAVVALVLLVAGHGLRTPF